MTKLDVVMHPNPILRQKCAEVSTFDDDRKQLVKDMFETMDAYDGIGLAAPQVGILDRMLVVGYEQRRFVLINPVIIESKGAVIGEEGCLSLPNILVEVERAETIKVEAMDLNGNKFVLKETDLVAVIIQHEMDHLDGVLIIDKEIK